MATTMPVPVLDRLIRQVREGGAQEVFPPVVTDGPAETLAPDGALGGVRDAEQVAALLAEDRFAPFRRAMERLDAWSVRAAAGIDADLLAPGVLDPVASALFAPTLGAIFTACHHSPARVAERLADLRVTQLLGALDLFLVRMATDLDAAHRPRDPRLAGPVVELRAHGAETHNGGLRVLRLAFAGGGALAYKPRPANGEALFLADGTTGDDRQPAQSGGLFERINALPEAAGPVRLPTLATWTGSGPGARGYSWHEWIEPPAERGPVRVDGSTTMTGTVLTPEQARRFWHRVGNLAATCTAFGVSDLIGGNVLAGARPHRAHDEPMLYPVDLECYFTGSTGLRATGLLGPAPSPTEEAADDDFEYPPGLEDTADWRALEGGALVWRRAADGTLRLLPMDRPPTRTVVPSAVADTEGGFGRAPHLLSMLRGMFDAWTLLCRHREAVRREVEPRAREAYIRIVPRPTADYARAIDARLRGTTAERHPDGEPFSVDEKAQLSRWDVPYYFCAAVPPEGDPAGPGAPLLALAPAPEPFLAKPVPFAESPEAEVPEFPSAGLHRYADPTLAALGPALRDAVVGVIEQLPDSRTLVDPALGVALRWSEGGTDGRVDFDWPRAGRRIGYEWAGGTLRIHLAKLDTPGEAS
ncbi:hypothetical protein B4N89_35135 [Embleya scabrispora]|uniref:Lantibiotic biosynthesis protein dehydration domain-containing protein n=1 Tax=Embleya scabrispora TaxID=159449 RepID=A0A1T3NRQ8_9ACTN|nr:DUF4135 domain-containing protein [Embleya scabrispora]OPC79291.1 hypothetical protein B4N89_35135 [Embleya scabrispora]